MADEKRHPAGWQRIYEFVVDRLRGTLAEQAEDIAGLRTDLDGLAAGSGNMTEEERAKLAGIATGATRNTADMDFSAQRVYTGGHLIAQLHFASRAAFEAATVPTWVIAWTVQHGTLVLHYVRDNAGVAIQSANGVKGSPSGQPEAGHYGIAPGTNIPDSLIAAVTLDVAGRGGRLYLPGSPYDYLLTDTAILHCSIYGDGPSGKWSAARETVIKTVGAGVVRRWHDKGTGIEADDQSRPVFVVGRSEISISDIRFDNAAGWEHDILLPATRAVEIRRVTSGGATGISLVLDQTWSDLNETLKAIHPTIQPGAGCNECRTIDCDLGGSVEGIGVVGTSRNPDDYTSEQWVWGWGGASDFEDRNSRVTGIYLNAACKNAAKMVQGLYFNGTTPRVGSRQNMLTVDRATRVVFTDSYAEASSGNTARVNFTPRTAANGTEKIVFRNCDWTRNTVWMQNAEGVYENTGIELRNGGNAGPGGDAGGLPFLDISNAEGTRWTSGLVYAANVIRPVVAGLASLGTSTRDFLQIRVRKIRSIVPWLWYRTYGTTAENPGHYWSSGNSQIQAFLGKGILKLFDPTVARPEAPDGEVELPDDPVLANGGLHFGPDFARPATALGARLGGQALPWQEVWTERVRSTGPFDLEALAFTFNGLPMPLCASRADLVARVADGFDPPENTVIFAGGDAYRRVIGATAIADLPGYEPYDSVMPDQFADNAIPGTTDMSAAIIAADVYAAAKGKAVDFAGAYAANALTQTASWDMQPGAKIVYNGGSNGECLRNASNGLKSGRIAIDLNGQEPRTGVYIEGDNNTYDEIALENATSDDQAWVVRGIYVAGDNNVVQVVSIKDFVNTGNTNDSSPQGLVTAGAGTGNDFVSVHGDNCRATVVNASSGDNSFGRVVTVNGQDNGFYAVAGKSTVGEIVYDGDDNVAGFRHGAHCSIGQIHILRSLGTSIFFGNCGDISIGEIFVHNNSKEVLHLNEADTGHIKIGRICGSLTNCAVFTLPSDFGTVRSLSIADIDLDVFIDDLTGWSQNSFMTFTACQELHIGKTRIDCVLSGITGSGFFYARFPETIYDSVVDTFRVGFYDSDGVTMHPTRTFFALNVCTGKTQLLEGVLNTSNDLRSANYATFQPGRIVWSGAPTAKTWRRGAQVWRENPASGSPMGWVCVASGSPGTWAAMPNLA